MAQNYPFSSAAGGDITVIAADGAATRQMEVVRMRLLCAGATTITLKDTAGNILSGPEPVAAGGGWVDNIMPAGAGGHYDVIGAGRGLVINSAAAVLVGGSVKVATRNA